MGVALALVSSAMAADYSFLWGAAFSAHQTEGGNDGSDWWDWEHTPGKIEGGQTTAVATDHYNRYPEDFALAASLGVSTVRFSVAWSRIEPENGRFNEKELAHYKNVVLDLRARGLIPVVTLHHFTHPRWFHAMGGWASPESPKIFARFAEKVAQALHPHVTIWITFNEPMVQIIEGYMKGGYPPGIKDFETAVKVFRNMVAAHGLSARALRKHTPPNSSKLPVHGVGLALNMSHFDPVNDPRTAAGREDMKAIETLSHLSQWAFLEAVQSGNLRYEIPSIPKLKKGFKENVGFPEAAHSLDWIGLNYYHRYLIARDPRNDLGARWVVHKDGLIHAPGLGSLLKETSKHLRDRIPIIVSENGLADAQDKIRRPFIQAHLEALKKARDSGVDVRGYWYWSLTDNFEWLSGFGPRFGLIEIDYSNLKRTIRPSAYWYRDFIKAHPDGP